MATDTAESSLQASSDDTEEHMAKLIEELSGEHCFESYQRLQHELLRRVDQDSVFSKESSAVREEYQAKEDSVFDHVEQHKENGENKLDLYDQQFKLAHDGMDHKTFTEQWFLKNTGQEIQLEKVLESPSFQDFVGVYDIQPITAYVASKMIIDKSDFMGLYDLGCKPAVLRKANTFVGIHEAADEEHEEVKQERLAYDEATRASLSYLHSDTMDSAEEGTELELRDDCREGGEATGGYPSPEDSTPAPACGCSDSAVMPHALGCGQFLQYRLRKENVTQYLDSSLIATRLKALIPDDPQEPIYIFTVSANGIMRYHPWGGTRRKLWHGYGDSENTEAFPKNIAHAASFGCFCFGIVYKERENYTDSSGTEHKGGRTIIMRYNRWATENTPVYAMVRQRSDEEDRSVPEQESTLKHYKHLLLGRKKKSASNKKQWLTF